jgi:hypothetical protein
VKFYIHPVNPHYAATHADVFAEGWQYGIWEHPYPALDPAQYQFQSKDLQGAQATRKQAEDATQHLKNELVTGRWLDLPRGVDPHSEAAARDTLQKAVMLCQPVRWPWIDAA